ncbi:MAG TPA: glycosyltransferase family 4 protein, partial [Chthonomonadaceae bacterium]|nr:glycosyltransferase family 4 protein [Chthonomonadaceae bacterium]
MDRRKVAPTLFAPGDFTLDPPITNVQRVDVPIGAKTEIVADWRAVRVLTKHLRGGFDLVHGHGLRGAWIGALAASRAGIPFLFTAHNLVSPAGLLLRACLRSIGQRAVRAIAVSQAVADMLAAAGFPAEKIVVIPNGIALEPFDAPFDAAETRAAYGIPAGAPLVLAVGRLAPEKGFDVLIEAFGRLSAHVPDARLALVGGGPLEETLKALAGERAILFTGPVAEVAPLLRAADVVAVPSRQEGQGIVALEAMAARKPVVASRVGGLAETVIEGETGLLVPPGDAEALAAVLETLLA